MADYKDYLKYLKHVDDTTVRDIKTREDALREEISALKINYETEKSEMAKAHNVEKTKMMKAHKAEKTKIEDAYKKQISDLEEANSKAQEELLAALSNITEEVEDTTGIDIIEGFFRTIGFLISLPLAGIPIFIFMKIKKRNVAKKLTQKYELVHQFYNKRAIVKSCGKYGYVNTSGRVVIPLKYNDAKDFTDKKAQVKYKNEWIYINKSGIVIE